MKKIALVAAGASSLIAASAMTRNMDQSRLAPPNEMCGTRFAGFAGETYDAKARTVEAVLSTGAAVRRWSFIEVLDISAEAIDLTRVEKGLVRLLDTHNQYELNAVLGSVSNVRIENGELVGTLHFADTENGRKAEGMVARGEMSGISIGYRVTKWEITKDAGEDNKLETWRATGWELLEASLVSVPADAGAGVRSATSDNPDNPLPTKKDDDMTRNQPGGAAVTATPAPAAAAAPAAPDTRAAPATPAPAVPASEATVRFTASEALRFVEDARGFGESVATRANELITQNEAGSITVEGARAALLQTAAEAQRAQTGGINGNGSVEITEDERDKWMRGATNSILQRAGLTDMVRKAAKERGEEIDLDPGEFRGVRNVELASWALEMDGVRSSSRDRNQIVAAALTGAAPGGFGRANPMQSTGMFPVVLENVMHKVLQAAYMTTPDTWRRFCGVGSVSDFRFHNRYLKGTFSKLDSLTESGEFKNKSIPDAAKELIKATTKGNIIALTRQAIVNDDLGAFNDLAVDLARAAKLSVEIDVYELLALNSGLGPVMNDGNTLFHADHGNIVTPAAAPTVTSIEAMAILMASQTDVSGNEILDIKPAVALSPIGLGGQMRLLNEAQYDPDTANKLQRPNIVNGTFADTVATARLSGTRYYGFADPQIAPAIEVVFLDGIQEPILDMQDGWRVDGTEWKVRFDYGVGGVNYRSAATNAGA